MNTTVMNSFFLTRSLLGLALFTVGLTSCQDDPDQLITPNATDATTTVSPEIAAKMDFIRATAGFTDESIVYQKGEFIVDDRILIGEADTDLRMAAAGTEPSARTEQQRLNGYLVDPLRVRDIKIAFDQSAFAASFVFAGAITAWNEAGSAVRFREVPISEPYDILVTRDDSVPVLRSSFPEFGGAPGPEIRAGADMAQFIGSTDQLQRLAAYGLGLVVGLAPSVGGTTYIEGTPEDDPESVMTNPALDLPLVLNRRG